LSDDHSRISGCLDGSPVCFDETRLCMSGDPTSRTIEVSGMRWDFDPKPFSPLTNWLKVLFATQNSPFSCTVKHRLRLPWVVTELHPEIAVEVDSISNRIQVFLGNSCCFQLLS